MIGRACGGLLLSLLLSAAAVAQIPEDYLDYFIVKVKPEKRAEFDAVSKKIADANRRSKGDFWLALETTYGDGITVYFVSPRRNYAEIEKASEAFVGALNKTFGPAGTSKVLQDFNNCILSTRGEVRRRRWGLSSNVPSDAAGMNKLVGEARWVRTVIVHVRPGQRLKFEEEVRATKAAQEKATPPVPVLVSQSEAGQEGTIYYFTTLLKTFGDQDSITPLSKLLGEEGYDTFLKVASETVESTTTVINHFLPELSNPPEEIAAVSPQFWRPKPAAAAKPKAKAAEAGKPEVKEKK